jgi:hypothetical protein
MDHETNLNNLCREIGHTLQATIGRRGAEGVPRMLTHTPHMIHNTGYVLQRGVHYLILTQTCWFHLSSHSKVSHIVTVATEPMFISLLILSWRRVRIFPPSQSQSQSHTATDGRSVNTSWCRAQSGTYDQSFFFKVTVLSFGGALSDERLGLSCVSLCHWSLQLSVNIYNKYLH